MIIYRLYILYATLVGLTSSIVDIIFNEKEKREKYVTQIQEF